MPTTLLMECHGRIRQFCGGLTALAALGEAELRQPAAVNTAAQCARYFREALPLHAQDEDESVLPWLKEQAVLQPVLATMQQEHRQFEVLIPDVVAVLETARRASWTPSCTASTPASTSGASPSKTTRSPTGSVVDGKIRPA
jgi:hypothetical protein